MDLLVFTGLLLRIRACVSEILDIKSHIKIIQSKFPQILCKLARKKLKFLQPCNKMASRSGPMEFLVWQNWLRKIRKELINGWRTCKNWGLLKDKSFNLFSKTVIRTCSMEEVKWLLGSLIQIFLNLNLMNLQICFFEKN